MPSGEIHWKFYKATSPAAIGAILWIAYFFSILLSFGFFIGYFFIARYADNDMDVFSVSKSESRAIKELKFLGYIFYGISSFYGAIFHKMHRSFLTHFPYVSTFIRMLFLFWWYPLLLYWGKFAFQLWQIEILIGIFFGLSAADIAHYFADIIFKETDKLEYRIFSRRKNERR